MALLRFLIVAAGLSAILAGCGGTDSSANGIGADAGPQALLTIRDSTFIPSDLVVAPGTTITVVNFDPMPHTVTSQSAPDQFTPGGVFGVSFDTGIFWHQSTIRIPANALRGTVIPYFCALQRGSMANAWQITVTAPPAP